MVLWHSFFDDFCNYHGVRMRINVPFFFHFSLFGKRGGLGFVATVARHCYN